MKICFVIGSVAISGGTYVVMQHASHMQQHGVDVTLAVVDPFNQATIAWHDAAPLLNIKTFNDCLPEQFDLVIATWWQTALIISKLNARHYAYFVQSIESRFYPESDTHTRQLVESTYQLPVHFVTEAIWIKHYLLKQYGKHADMVRNGIRKDIYNTFGTATSPRLTNTYPRVLVEGHFGVSFKNTALAVSIAKQAGVKDIWVLTSSDVSWIPGVSRVFSKVPIAQTAKVYRSCDILLKLSTVEGMFGPPLEIFHCGGTALVFDVTGHDEYIVNNVNGKVITTRNVSEIIIQLKQLLEDRQLLASLKKGAQLTASQWPSWSESSAEFLAWVQNTCKISKSSQPPTSCRATLEKLTALASHSPHIDDKKKKPFFNLPNLQLLKKIKTAFETHFPFTIKLLRHLKIAYQVLFNDGKVR